MRKGLHLHIYLKFIVLIVTIVLSAAFELPELPLALMCLLMVFALTQGYYKYTAFNVGIFAVCYLVIFCYNYFGWSDEVFSRMIFAMTKKNMSVCFAVCIIAATPPSEITESLDRLKFPKGTAIAIIAIFRYLPTVRAELRKNRENMRVRRLTGFRQFICHPFRYFKNIIIPFTVRALSVAEELSISAITRGAESKCKRTSLYGKRFGVIDIFALVFLAVGFTLAYFVGVSL